jgi:hypothetical protein
LAPDWLGSVADVAIDGPVTNDRIIDIEREGRMGFRDLQAGVVGGRL